MSNEFLVDLSSKVGKSTDELANEFADYRDSIEQKYNGRLTGEKLDQRAQALFRQKYRAELVAIESSPAKPFNFFVMGISDIKDGVSYNRKEAVELYEANPNKYVMEGRINEYTEVDDGILKRYHSHFHTTDTGAKDYDSKKDPASEEYEPIIEEIVAKVSDNAEEFGEESGLWIAPVDVNEFGFGSKANKGYGLEYPRNKYSRYVYGVAEPQSGGDAKWARYMLRGDTATQTMPAINNAYVVRALNFTKKDDIDYNLMNMPKQAVFVETDWNPFGEASFVESILELDFMADKTIVLGEVENFLIDVEAKKKARTYGLHNQAILVEVDVMELYPNLDPEKDWSDKMVVDDESLRADFDIEKIQSNITTWVSKANTIDFGTDSRVLLTCFPIRGRKAEGEEVGPMRLNAFGVYAFEDLKTDFDMEDFKKEDL